MKSKKEEKILDEIKKLISHCTAQDNEKAKKLAMRNNIKLGKLRREFCQKCFESLRGVKVRIKKGYKIVGCEKCKKVYRFKIS